ncbi:MAG: SAM-dependent methyltransferase [Flavobacteriales bacterium CG_4_10_14_0_2_um_filter_32_8]|nr:MAG: SAM-dependent methyltransferase [Flavobacteriales bacterium CG_4_10_14_0_2_um_filter_32_8]PJB15010.1 MAG: SAM-dependent methyltransferase [Flavobacteriales bacterium CG_4_9_14_3_um_filter_32_8]
MSNKGTLYLIPVTLGDSPIAQVIPSFNTEIINEIDVYIVENIKTARRFLKKSGLLKEIDELTFFELNKRTHSTELSKFIKPIFDGKNVGVMSEAGCPGVADPGADIVALAQQKNIKVVPLVGPSSILLALMASGFNGQSFCFNGYLPKEQKDRIGKLKELERRVKTQQQTQLFIETPFRNDNILEDLLKNCFATTLLCIAVDITLPSERITTKTIEEWKKIKLNLNKRPCIFLIG